MESGSSLGPLVLTDFKVLGGSVLLGGVLVEAVQDLVYFRVNLVDAIHSLGVSLVGVSVN